MDPPSTDRILQYSTFAPHTFSGQQSPEEAISSRSPRILGATLPSPSPSPKSEPDSSTTALDLLPTSIDIPTSKELLLSKCKDVIEDLQHEINSGKSENTWLKQKIPSLWSDFEFITKGFERSRLLENDKNLEHQTYSNQNTSLVQNLSRLDVSLDHFKSSVINLSEINETLKSKIFKNQSEHANLNSSLSKKNQSYHQTHTDLLRHKEITQLYNETVKNRKDMEIVKDRYEKENFGLRAKFEHMLKMEKDVDLVRLTVKKDRIVLKGLRNENFALKEDLGNRTKVFGEMEVECGSLREEVVRGEGRENGLVQEIVSFRRVRDLEERNRVLVGRNGDLERRCDEMQKDSEITNRILARVTDEKSSLERKRADGRMDTQITEKNGTLRQTEKKLAKIMGELEVLRGQN
jgi:hypothetical protein